MRRLPAWDHETACAPGARGVDPLGVGDGREAVLTGMDEEHGRPHLPDRVQGRGSRASKPPRRDEAKSAPGTKIFAQLPYCSSAWTRAMSPRLENEESATTNATALPGSDAAWIAVAAPYDQPMIPIFERGSPVRSSSHSNALQEVVPLVGAETQDRAVAVAVPPRVVEEEVAAALPEDRCRPQDLGLAAAEAVEHHGRAPGVARVVEVPGGEVHALASDRQALGVRQAVLGELVGPERRELPGDELLGEEPRDGAVPEHDEQDDGEVTASQRRTTREISAGSDARC